MQTTPDFDDLMDMDDFAADDAVAYATLDGAPAQPTAAALHKEICSKCSGSGKFISYHGRTIGECFTCKGLGYKLFKAPAEQRAKATATRAKYAAARRELDAANARATLAADHPGVLEWLESSAPRFEFAASLLAALDKFGSLTDNQLAAAQRCIDRDAERAATRQAAAQVRAAAAPTVDIGRIETAFGAARDKGLIRVKLTLGDVVFTPAKPDGVNPGAVYAKDREGVYLGKVAGGRFHRSRDCDDAAEALVVTAASDPLAAAVAYGQRTGHCAICSRLLTNEDSIGRGIGPICAERLGW